jgi:hypothetical protein
MSVRAPSTHLDKIVLVNRILVPVSLLDLVLQLHRIIKVLDVVCDRGDHRSLLTVVFALVLVVEGPNNLVLVVVAAGWEFGDGYFVRMTM